MSKLKASTLSNLAGTAETPMENAIHGSAKVWVNFNGTGTIAIRASYNVSSLTDNGVGSYIVNFTTALVDSNHSTNVSSGTTGSGGATGGLAEVAPVNNAVQVEGRRRDTGAVVDQTYMSVSVFR